MSSGWWKLGGPAGKWIGDSLAHRNGVNERNNAFYAAHGGSPSDQYGEALDFERQGGGWEDAFKRTAGAFVQGQLPQLRDSLQMSRENAIQRGVSTGDYQTSREGDLVSAWGRNLDQALGGMAMQGYENNRNNYYDLLSGSLDRKQAARNAQQQMWGGLLGAGMQAGAFAAGG